MSLDRREYPYLAALLVPVVVVFAAFFLLPMAKLIAIGGSGEAGFREYLTVVNTPRHFESLVATVVLSATVTLAGLFSKIIFVRGVIASATRFTSMRKSG